MGPCWEANPGSWAWEWAGLDSRGWSWAQGQTDNQLVYTCLKLQLSTAHIHSDWSMPMLYVAIKSIF